MRVLIIGAGGREHALAWKVAQEAHVQQVFVAPGNAGTAVETKVRNVAIAAEDIAALTAFARDNAIDLTIVGPEAPLVAGVVDAFKAAKLRCFGPSADAAQLEGSKAFAKAFMQRHGIPTASYRRFTRDDFDPQYLKKQRLPVVIKASGLAAGKGVVIAESTAEALQTAQDMLSGKFGTASHEIIVEEFLRGEEASFIVIADGQHVLPLATSQDHKRLGDGDAGPNTGGMGAYSPAPVVSPEIHNRIMQEVILPTIKGLATEGLPYTGFLYAGVMIAADGTPNVLEFNCRLGDPETQPVLMRLQSDLTLLCNAALDGKLNTATAQWDDRTAVGVVIAAAGYPDSARKNDAIEGLEKAASLPGKVFHAGTRLDADTVVTHGGRVLCATALGADIAAAAKNAYGLVTQIHFNGAQYRRDIGYRALARLKNSRE
jgi:phosphoribosylamine---glycine ligase